MGHQNGEIGDHLGQLYERLGRGGEAISTYALAMATTVPVPETRSRLAALVGGTAAADSLAEQATSTGLQELQTVRLGRLTSGSVAGEVRLLLGPGPRVEDVRVTAGTSAQNALADKLRAAGAAFPNIFPDSASIRVPLRGQLECSATGDCSFVLLEMGGARNGMPSTPALN